MGKAEEKSSLASVGRESYKKTLAKYHPWLIQKSAMLALYSLPYRHQFIERAFGCVPTPEQMDKIGEYMLKLSQIADEVYNVTEKLYEEHNLLDLP